MKKTKRVHHASPSFSLGKTNVDWTTVVAVLAVSLFAAVIGFSLGQYNTASAPTQLQAPSY